MVALEHVSLYISHGKDNNLPISLKSLPEDSSVATCPEWETEPGFDKLVHNISGLQKAIKPLTEWAENQIPKNSHSRTSLFLHATVGGVQILNGCLRMLG